MVEYETSDSTYFTFTNRTPKPDARGYVALFRLPSEAMLTASRFIDLVVLVLAVFSQFYPETRHAGAQILFAIQGAHLAFKLGFLWKPVQVHAATITAAFDADVPLQSEHTAFLVSLAFILGQLVEGSDGFGLTLSATQLVLALGALALTRPVRPALAD